MFDPQHKKKLPTYPGTIGVVTSSAGAAIHDMLRILRKRYPLTNVRLLPVRVQGAEAPAEIAAAIHYANRYKLADLLIVGRGGGSIEDLWAFNDELVAHAIYQSEIPVISAVGHEPDVTISDYVADLRAATPSNAAELAVPDSDNLRQQLDSFLVSMQTIVKRQLKTARQHLKAYSDSAALQSPMRYISQRADALALVKSRLVAAQQRSVSLKRHQFVALTAKLDAMSPLKVLTRGYAMVQSMSGEVIRSTRQVSPTDYATILLSDGKIKVSINEILEEQP